MNRLLIVACSERKTGAGGVIPAIDRYDGPAFRVLRKFLRTSAEEQPTVVILSGKFGLIAASKRIPNYDCQLSAALAKEIRPKVTSAVRRLFRIGTWDAVGVCAGKHYRIALRDALNIIPDEVPIDEIGGGLGVRLMRLRAWLHRRAPRKATPC